MNDQKNIQDELRSMNSSLPVNDGQQPYTVPAGYFDGLAAQILAKAKTQEASAADELQAISPLLAGLSKELPYSVPAGYFEKNADFLLPLVKEEETSPVLAAIGKKMPFAVPPNYFEEVPMQVMASLNRPKAKVVPFFTRTWARAAVAAAIGGIVLFGGYRLLTGNPSTEAPPVAIQSPADTAAGQLAQNKTGVATDLKNISAEEVEVFMQNLPVNPASVQRTAAAPAERQDMAKWLKDVPQEEIDAFLEALPTADETLPVID